MTPGTTIPEGSPQLDQPLPRRHEAALRIAIRGLNAVRHSTLDHVAKAAAEEALADIAALIPEAMK